jgi:hypothetical protein
MARTRQRAAASDPQPIGDAVDTVVSNAIIEPDVFDQAIADRQLVPPQGQMLGLRIL